MKKYIIAALAAISLGAQAQPFYSQDVLNVPAVYATNTVQITNLTLNSFGTNIVGTAFTNSAGTLTVSSGATGTGVNLLKDVLFWSDRNARWYGVYTNVGLAVLQNEHSPFNISVSLAGGSGANAAVTFVFAPIWDEEKGTVFTGSHDSADTFTFSFSATTTSTLSRSTNVPVWRWPGARGLRCLRIINEDTDATSHVIIEKLKLNGYRP